MVQNNNKIFRTITINSVRENKKTKSQIENLRTVCHTKSTEYHPKMGQSSYQHQIFLFYFLYF